jgi:hypothetical protein
MKPYSPEGCGFCEVMPPFHKPYCPAFGTGAPLDDFIARLEEVVNEDRPQPGRDY